MDEMESNVNTEKKLTRIEKRNLCLLVLSYSFLTSALSVIVGTSSVEVKYLEKEDEESENIAPLAYALFMMGTAFISLVTKPIFQCGRKAGFITGNIFGIVGAILGAVAVQIQSIPLLMISYVILGVANGIGNYLRFAALEVVPVEYEALAVTLMLSGGVLSAFVGPEASQDTKFIFAKEPFLNIFVMLCFFYVIMLLLVSFVRFPTKIIEKEKTEEEVSACGEQSNKKYEPRYLSLVMSCKFWIPTMLASLTWCVMTMPMSITRVAMEDAGYSPRQSLTVIEVHFLGMFIPGFFSGKIIKRRGNVFSFVLAVLCFIVGLILNLVSETNEKGTIATWILGLFFMGVGWHFGFASATVWLTHVYDSCPSLKSEIQSTNDFIMFFITGVMVVCTGFIYDPDGLGFVGNILRGWRAVNFVTLAFVGALGSFVLFGYFHKQIESKTLKVKNEASNDIPKAHEKGEFA